MERAAIFLMRASVVAALVIGLCACATGTWTLNRDRPGVTWERR